MQIHTINPAFSVSDQIDEHDVASVAAAGFRCVVNNRPDAEGGTPAALIQAACDRHGLKFFSLPVEYSLLSLSDAERFSAILRQCEPPLLAYCRSGRRSTALWALAMAAQAQAPVPALLARSAQAGVPLEDLRKLLDRSAGRTAAVAEPGTEADTAAFARRWFEGR